MVGTAAALQNKFFYLRNCFTNIALERYKCITYYSNRPDSLEQRCFFDIASYFDFKKDKCLENVNHEKCVALKNGLGYLHKRSERYLIKTPRYN